MIASLLFRASLRRFERACESPLHAQAETLRRVLRQASATGIGREHGFAAIAKERNPASLIAQYQSTIPVRTHAGFQAELNAVREGDWARLCPSQPQFFAMTAGSTGHFKYIPMTRELLGDLGRGSLIVYGALEATCPELRRLKAQFLVGSAEGGLTPGGIPQGFASGFNYRALPWLLRRKFVLPYWIFTLEDAAERAYAAGRILVSERKLGALCAISPVNLTNVMRALEQNAERLIADVRAGLLTVHCRAAVAGTFRTRPDRALADTLRAAWRSTGRMPPRLLFPALRTLVCWQGGNMGYYLNELGSAFELERFFEFPISASEGLFAIPRECNRAGGTLAVTTHFLEFMPAEGPAPVTALRADQLVAGAEYRLIVTNSGGLYRYDMEDIVRVTGFHARTPVITFVAKAERRVSVANERITELDATVAMEAASRSSGVWCSEFLFVPCSDRRYRIILDGAVLGSGGAADGDGIANLARALEHALRRSAVGYDFEREDALLEPLEVIVSAPGELKAFVGPRPEQTRIPNAQLKPVHLTPEFDAHRRFTVVYSCAA